MDPLSLQNLLSHFDNEIDTINKNWMVIDENHVVKDLSEISTDENILLIGLMPNYGTDAENSDNVLDKSFSQFLILEKTDYSELNRQQFLDIFQRTFLVAKEIKDRLIEYSADKQCEFPYLMQLDINSLKMEPIYKLAQCNGWALEFDL